MRQKQNLYESWDNKEIEGTIAVYQNERGHLSLAKLPSSSTADKWFWVLLSLMVTILLATVGVFSGLNELWGESHLATLAYLEFYPALILFFVGLHVIGYRYDELQKYLAMKKTLKRRNLGEKNHGKAYHA